MIICDVVYNSIWYDPRVKKQIIQYLDVKDVELCCVGFQCKRYNLEEIKKINCPVEIVMMKDKYYRKERTIFTKIAREISALYKMTRAIVRTKADIIHANDMDALLPAYLASRKLKCKLIYDSHEIFLENNNIVNKKWNKRYWAFWECYIIKRVDLVVAVSRAAAEYLAEKYSMNKPMVVTNCVNKVDKKKQITMKAEKFEVLNHGQFYEGRGYEMMIEAGRMTSSYENIEFVLRGLGKLESKLRKQIMDENIKNVRMDPPVYVHELIPMAAKSYVGLAITEPYCLNFKLSVSNKLFEYAAAGLPVIMSDIPEHRYLNERYHFGIIIPENTPEALVQAVIKLYTDKVFYEECAGNARKLSDEINWENEFQKLIDLEHQWMKEK